MIAQDNNACFFLVKGANMYIASSPRGTRSSTCNISTPKPSPNAMPPQDAEEGLVDIETDMSIDVADDDDLDVVRIQSSIHI